MSETKSLQELYKEGKLSKDNIKSIVFLAQTGMYFSSHTDDTIFIEKQIKRLEEGFDLDL